MIRKSGTRRLSFSNGRRIGVRVTIRRGQATIGGFIYSPDGESKAGEDAAGSPRSYASMTGYAGLLSFIYANVDKEDERVIKRLSSGLRSISRLKRTTVWVRKVYYYNYHTMANSIEALWAVNFCRRERYLARLVPRVR